MTIEEQKNLKQKRQIEAMSNPEEARKINQLKKDLSECSVLIEVNEVDPYFEMATNRHFNKHMNKMQARENLRNWNIETVIENQSSGKSGQKATMDSIKGALSGSFSVKNNNVNNSDSRDASPQNQQLNMNKR